MSAAVLVPVEEYLRLTEKPYREYRDGVVSLKLGPLSCTPSFNTCS
jgi:hypothetical protein